MPIYPIFIRIFIFNRIISSLLLVLLSIFITTCVVFVLVRGFSSIDLTKYFNNITLVLCIIFYSFHFRSHCIPSIIFDMYIISMLKYRRL